MVNMPNHIALIPDGNRRWAKLHDVPPLEGHQAGAKTMHRVVDYLANRGIKYLTLWGFSTDNWKRSHDEVSSLFQLLAGWIEGDAPWLNTNGVQLRHIGRFDEVPQFLQLAINKAVELTQNNNGMTLTLAFNYGGRGELVDAVRRLIDKGIPSHLVDEKRFSSCLYTNGMPDVDLVIRTADEFRLSNFMLWQTAYSEYFFTEALWPDFGVEELEKALKAYSERKRRFGGD